MRANVHGIHEGTTSLRHRTSRGVLAALTGGLVVAAAWVAGPLTAHGAGGDMPTTGACTSTISGPHTGNLSLSVPGTVTCLKSANQNGAITVASGAALSVIDSTVTGAITSTSAAPFAFCHSNTVRGAISVASSKGLVLIGGGPDGAVSCGPNNVDGAITVNGNSGGVEVGGNTTSGAITVTGNTAPTSGAPTEDAATEVEGNHDGGKLTCTGNTPAPVNDGSANTISGARVGQTCASGTF
jgi:hexosaminidase